MTDPVSSISGANWQDTTASNLILDDGDLRQAGAPEANVGSVPNNNNDQVAALAAAVTQIQQALAKQQLNTDIAAQAASSLPSDATTDPGHPSAAYDLKEFQRLPQSLSYDIDNPPRINTQRPSSNLWQKRCLQRTRGPLASFTSGCAPSETLPAPFVCKTRCVLQSCI